MIKHFCDLTGQEVREEDIYTISIINKKTGKVGMRSIDISVHEKQKLEFHLNSRRKVL